MLGFIKNHIEFISGFMISLFGLLVPLWQYINTKNKEQKQANLVNFHEKIISKISNQKGEFGLDEQIAVIFELRNFPQYSPVIVRILRDGILRWEKEQDQKYKRLITEAKETIQFLDCTSC